MIDFEELDDEFITFLKEIDNINKYKFLKYQPKHQYVFNIYDEYVELLVDDIPLTITEESILNIDLLEMVYGVLPAVINTIRPIIKSMPGVSKFFLNPTQYIPQVLENGDPYVDNRVFAFLHLILFYKRVVTNEMAHAFLNKYCKSNDVCHMYRQGAYGAGIYILQNANHEFEPHGFTNKYTNGSYVLWSLYEPKPQQRANRDKLDPNIFTKIKQENKFQCDLCGSTEGQPHLEHPASITILQEGHIYPYRPLSIQNCKPHCQHCNRKIKNNYTMEVYPKNGEMALFVEHKYIKSMWKTKKEFYQNMIKEASKIYDS